jgi:signal transduction histidine kinase/ActR/RegA family two-component response regulator
LPESASASRNQPGLTVQALDAQVRLLPYALAFFGLCLPIFLCTAALAPNRAWLGLSLGIYAINWTAFYAVIDWLKKAPAGGRDLRLRGAVQLAGGALWAAAIAQTSWFALGAGPVSQLLLILCVGASTGVIFFSAPSLPALLTVGPAAAAAPVIALLGRPQTHEAGELALSGAALALALGLIFNRHLREHFTLAAEREQLIAEREAALASAQALARSKSDLVSTLSHEIRNGLAGVTYVLAGALGAGSRGAPSREQLKAGLEAAQGLAGVLDATLDAESAEAGRLEVAARPVAVPSLVQDLVLLHRPTASAKGLELIARIEEGLLEGRGAAIADSARVRQILNNLIGNAVKYTIRGRVEATVACPAPDRIRIEIVDTGPGLSPEELALAFEPFKRVNRTGAGVPGAGLGLSLSRRLAGLMGGAVEAESAPGVGSRFWLELPFDAQVQAAKAADETADRALRVLFAEDDALGSAMLRACLEQLGHRPLHVQDGGRALELLELGEVDLVMLDGRMPGVTGFDAARRIRALPDARSGLPIVGVIGGDPADASALLEAGADAVVRKPVSVAAIARAIADARSAPRRRSAKSAAA